MEAKDIKDNAWFMTMEHKWFKKISYEEKTNTVLATQIGNKRIFTIEGSEEVQLRT